jgi:ElaB/YqjD/DUF883 family membrane-anchored ribosome-binding protein
MFAVPLELRERSRQHGADLLREMTLISTSQTAGTAGRGVPARLLELAQELDAVYGPYVASTTEEMEAALDRGEQVLDEVVYRLPASSGAFVQRVAEVLAEVEQYCRADDHLLTLAPPPDVAAYRSWSLGEVLRQQAGEAPTPWPAYAAADHVE